MKKLIDDGTSAKEESKAVDVFTDREIEERSR